MKIDEKAETAFDINYGKKQVHQSSQTELQATVKRNIDLVILYDKPFKPESDKPLTLEQSTMTDVSTRIINFCAKGA